MGWPKAIIESLTELLVIFGDIIYLSHEEFSYLNTQEVIQLVAIILKFFEKTYS